MKTAELIMEATALPVEERALIVDSLLRTLNPAEPEITQAWIKTATHRAETLRDGSAKTVPADEVFEKIHRKFGN